MEISGKIIQINPLQQGEGKNGTWKKQEYILEVPGNYPKKVCVTVWGNRVDDFAIQQGEDVTFSIDVESREFNGRWYTDVKAWKVERQSPQVPNSSFDNLPENPSFSAEDAGEASDDLPF